jgi:hypothetical protein
MNKTDIFPSERVRLCRNALSIIGLKTIPITNGAGSNSNFLIKYPIIPKKIIIKISMTLLFRLYTPIRQKRMIMGNNRI